MELILSCGNATEEITSIGQLMRTGTSVVSSIQRSVWIHKVHQLPTERQLRFGIVWIIISPRNGRSHQVARFVRSGIRVNALILLELKYSTAIKSLFGTAMEEITRNGTFDPKHVKSEIMMNGIFGRFVFV